MAHNKKYVEYSLLLDAVRTADQPAHFLELISNKENAIAGSYWSGLDHPYGEHHFVLQAVFGRDEVEGQIGKTRFNLSDSWLFARTAIKEKRVFSKFIKNDKLSRKWLSKKYTQDLKKLKIKRVVVIPVFDATGGPTGIFSLYFQHREPINLQELFLACQIQSVAILASNKQLEASRLERSKSRHEILAHSRMIYEKLADIKKEIQTIKPLLSNYGHVENLLDTTISSARVLKHSFERGTFLERVSLRKKYAKWLDLSAFLIRSQNSALIHARPGRSIVTGTVPVTEWQIGFYKDDLQILFSNIYSNAIKYSMPSSVVKTKIQEVDGQLLISVHNDVEIDRSDDLHEIFNYEQRGEYARRSGIEGEGLGLGLVSDICDVYDSGVWADYKLGKNKTLTKEFILFFNVPKYYYRAMGIE